MVQIGNEVICGVLWDDGRVCGDWDTPEQWAKFGQITAEGIRGVNDALDPEDSIRIVIHIDCGGDSGRSIWFFDNLLAQGIEFDIIGLSYYPWWHGTLSAVEANLDNLAERYSKDLAIMESAYPWTLGWYDDMHNIVGLPEQLHPGYPASVPGQKAFMVDLMEIIANVRDCRGLGLFYWSPEYISVPGLGSPWENLTLYSFTGETLGSIAAFDSVITSVQPVREPLVPYRLNQNYPNPFGPQTKICFELGCDAHVDLTVFSLLGETLQTLASGVHPAGINVVYWDGTKGDGQTLPCGVYICSLRSGVQVQTRKMILLR
jgi:arabinogalactan endo-1,4-beta-galactosidase